MKGGGMLTRERRGRGLRGGGFIEREADATVSSPGSSSPVTAVAMRSGVMGYGPCRERVVRDEIEDEVDGMME